VAIEEMMPRIKELAHIRGWSDHDIGWLTLSLVGYAEYSFGKSHSTSYGMVAYRQGYMKKHHPPEFWTGVLTAYSNHEKEPGYVNAARRDGVRIASPMVNVSKVSYSMDKETKIIRKGYLSVKGIGIVGAPSWTRKAVHLAGRPGPEGASVQGVRGQGPGARQVPVRLRGHHRCPGRRRGRSRNWRDRHGPDECLAMIRNRVREMHSPRSALYWKESAAEAVELFDKLDEWISKGGFLPEAWSGPARWAGAGTPLTVWCWKVWCMASAAATTPAAGASRAPRPTGQGSTRTRRHGHEDPQGRHGEQVHLPPTKQRRCERGSRGDEGWAGLAVLPRWSRT